MAKLIKADKDALLRFQLLKERVQNNTAIDVFESKEERHQRVATLLKSFPDFCQYYFPHYSKYDFAPFHVKVANQIQKDPYALFAVNWFRGAAKSTVMGLFLPLWLKCLEDEFCMIMSNKSKDGAAKLLSELQAELEFNERFKNDFGVQKKFGSWEEGEFVTKDGAAFFAFGRGQSPRGVKHHGLRPTFILGDDMDDDELVLNEKRVRKAFDWLIEAVYGTADMGRCRFGLLGNVIGKNSIMTRFIEQMKDNKHFIHSVVNVRNKKGRSTWPAKNSEEDIDRTIKVMGTRRAQKELFNNPIVEGTIFKRDWFTYNKAMKWSNYSEVIEYCDPSMKGTDKSDYKVIIQLAWDGKFIWIMDCYCRQATIGKFAEAWYDMYERLPEHVAVNRWMEGTFAQDMLLDDFEREGKRRGYQLNIRADKRSKPDKFQRIEAMSALFERGLVKISTKLKDNADWKTALEQFLSIEQGSRGNDDAPDAFEGGVYKLQKNARVRQHNIEFGERILKHSY